jgi:hypothetical protein
MLMKKTRRLPLLLLMVVFIALQGGCGDSSTHSVLLIQETEEAGGSVASFVFATITEGILKGVASEGGEFAAGWILNLLFNGGENPDADTKAALDKIQNQLNMIQSQLSQIEGDLSALYVQANTNTDDIKATIAKVDVANELDTIDVLHKELVSLNVNPDSFAAEILDPKTGAPMLLGVVSDKMVGLGDSGVLDLLVAFLIDKARTNKSNTPNLDAYLALEYYFGNALTIQGQGLNLISEAYHQIKANPGSPAAQYLPAGKDPIAALQDYIDKMYNPQIEAQMQKFLACVELLVAKTASTTAPTASFIPDADTIFRRADFIVDQWRNRDGKAGSSLYIRVAGEPERLKIYGDSWSSAASGAPVAFSVVPGWSAGSGIQQAVNSRLYPVSPHYAQWPPLLPAGTFSEANAIAAAKYSAPATAPGPVTIQTQYDGSVTVAVNYYDNEMKQVDGPTYQITVPHADGTTTTITMQSSLYGHSLVAAKKDLFLSLNWQGYNDKIDAGNLCKSSDCFDGYVRGGNFHSRLDAGPAPKSIDSSVGGWANGSQNSFELIMQGHMSTTSRLVFSGPAARSISINAATYRVLNENDGDNIVKRKSPTHYEYWFSTDNSDDRQVKTFDVKGGHTLLDAFNTFSIQKNVANGASFRLEAGYDGLANIFPRMFHSDRYSLEMKMEIDRLWIIFPDT